MNRFPTPRALALWPVLFALLPLACSRPIDTAQAVNQNLRSDPGLPFRDGQSLPAGTLVTVRLKDPIAAQSPGYSGVFDAVVDEAVAADGNPVLPRGANVAGRVESAQASGLRRNGGSVRLTLESVKIGDRELPIQTSSLFVHGNTVETPAAGGAPSAQVVRLESGRRLTFRLTEPLSLVSPQETQPH